ncbi:MAG: hypothetical protein WD751_02850 [Anaerolineales bacterium]
MLKQQEKTFILTPFVVAHQKSGVEEGSTVASRTRKPGTHLSKEEATREVLTRIVRRVKKI